MTPYVINKGRLNVRFIAYIVINKKINFDKTILVSLIGNAANLLLSSELKNNFIAVNVQNTVNKVEIINKNKEK